MEPFDSVESTEGAGSDPQGKVTTSLTSSTKPSKRIPKELPDITPDDRLKMIQTILAEKVPGVTIRRATVYFNDQPVAGAMFIGCQWDEAGNLILAERVGNA